MNTKEAAKKWGCSEKTVREYCSNGLIPLADKISGKWFVPDEMRKLPPVTLKKAVYLLSCLEDNVLPAVSGYWNENKLSDALVYLSDMRFIIGYEGHVSLEEAAEQCRVSKLGKRLIERGKERDDTEVSRDIGIKVGIESGLPKAEISYNVKKNKNKMDN